LGVASLRSVRRVKLRLALEGRARAALRVGFLWQALIGETPLTIPPQAQTYLCGAGKASPHA